MLDAARECVLSNKLEGKYQDSVRNLTVKFDSWRTEVTRSYSQGPNSVRKAIHSVLRSAYANRWNRNLAKAVEELSRGACNFDSLNRFISAIRLEGDFVVEDTSGASGMSKGSGEGETSSSIGGGGISDRSGPMGEYFLAISPMGLLHLEIIVELLMIFQRSRSRGSYSRARVNAIREGRDCLQRQRFG